MAGNHTSFYFGEITYERNLEWESDILTQFYFCFKLYAEACWKIATFRIKNCYRKAS